VSVVHAEFREQTLALRITNGILEEAPVRAHSAVVAELQLYPIERTIADVFLPALRTLEEVSGTHARRSAAAIIQLHVRQLLQAHPI
jgi:hypothetical protein